MVGSSDSGMNDVQIRKISNWVARVGQILGTLFPPTSQYRVSYNTALQEKGFWNLHGNHFAHLIRGALSPQPSIPAAWRIKALTPRPSVVADQGCTRYLAYECKRLNVHYNGVRQSLSTSYVKEGVKRFITEQYAEGLPIGCMIGCVLDGDIDFAIDKIHTAIKNNKDEVCLKEGPNAISAISGVERFATSHRCINSGLETAQ